MKLVIKIVFFIIFILNVFCLWYRRLKVYGKDLLLILKIRKTYLLSFINYVQFFIFILYFVIGFPCYYINLLIFLIILLKLKKKIIKRKKNYKEFLLDLYTISPEETYTDKLEREMNDNDNNDNDNNDNDNNDNDNDIKNDDILNPKFELGSDNEDLINKTNEVFSNDILKNKKLLNNSIGVNKIEFNQDVLNSLNNDINTNVTNILNKTILDSTLSSKFFKSDSSNVITTVDKISSKKKSY